MLLADDRSGSDSTSSVISHSVLALYVTSKSLGSESPDIPVYNLRVGETVESVIEEMRLEKAFVR